LNIKLRVCESNPILTTGRLPQLGRNINGPSLIRAPKWLKDPIANYYLYFAHHKGKSIRLATANTLEGPWKLYEPGTLHLAKSGFPQRPPTREAMLPEVIQQIEQGIEGDYPHIASPDVHVDDSQQLIQMYFHGRMPDGSQKTKLAVSVDGINFNTRPEVLGISYFRVFQYNGWYYALALGGAIYRSIDGQSNFEYGGQITSDAFRHCAVWVHSEKIHVFWTRIGDCPESLLVSTLNTLGNWTKWSLTDTNVLRAPQFKWEGADQPVVTSVAGASMNRVCQLRDPAIYTETQNSWLLYSIAGEQGLAIAELVLN